MQRTLAHWFSLILAVSPLVGGCSPDSPDDGDAGGDAQDAGDQGTCTNPETGEQGTPVQCLVDPCSVETCDGDPQATCEADYCGGCHAIFTAADGSPAACELVACTADAKQCPDGSYVSRDPANDCEWFACP